MRKIILLVATCILLCSCNGGNLIDKIVVSHVENEGEGCFIDMAKELDLTTVAEGVEDQSQSDLLKSMGCDIVQGYYFSKPLPAEEFERFLKPENAESDC